jgi:hypothetical protein
MKLGARTQADFRDEERRRAEAVALHRGVCSCSLARHAIGTAIGAFQIYPHRASGHYAHRHVFYAANEALSRHSASRRCSHKSNQGITRSSYTHDIACSTLNKQRQ